MKTVGKKGVRQPYLFSVPGSPAGSQSILNAPYSLREYTEFILRITLNIHPPGKHTKIHIFIHIRLFFKHD